MTSTRRLWPGLLFCLLGAAVAVAIGAVLPSVSPLLIAILIGVTWRNTVGVRASWAPGTGFAGRQLLRAGIVLLGLQISLVDVLGLGAGTILLVIAAVGVTFAATVALGRALGLTGPQSTLIAAGFSICGAAAVAAAEDVVDGEEEETATAIALVVLFGTLMIPLMPLLVGLLHLSPHAGGIWIGASTHEVAQVVAAAGLVGPDALAVAVTVKLSRVLLLAPLMALLAVRRRAEAREAGREVRLPPIVPLFVAGFIVAMIARSTGWLPTALLDVCALAQRLLLSAAMLALGLGVDVRAMLRVGGRTLGLAAAATGIIGAIGLVGALVLG
ncbi:MAG: putative sulfate exporter family transporter [Arachnia sp.]